MRVNMNGEIKLYHGSTRVIKEPVFGKGNPKNDYGLGFYCTESQELAKEWACSAETDGFVNQYILDTRKLSILDLSSGEYHILNWLAILLQNRTFRMGSDIAIRAKEYIKEHFLPDYEKYDVIKGYRADDSYFSFATAFLNNTISLVQLEKAMYLGKLGEQVVLKSKKSFQQLTFVESIIADKTFYYPQKMARDCFAREEFKREKSKIPAEQEIYMIDIMRGRWKNDDARLQRIILG